MAKDLRPPFEGFDSASVALFARMPGWSKEEYAEHRAQLRAGVLDPALSLIVEVADDLGERLGVELTVNPRIGGSVSPLNRDLRFAQAGTDAELYKDHVLLTCWDGDDKRTSPTFWIRLSHDTIGFASGVAFGPGVPDGAERRERWRSAVADDVSGPELVAAVESLRRHPTFDLAGEDLKRTPKPWSDDHPRAALLRHNGCQIRWSEPLPPTATLARFRGFCVDKLAELGPVHHWFREHVARPR